MATTRSIILDTDIGSDVDDAMALALILGRDDLDLVGITTVYGDTALRAGLAKRYLSLADVDVPVYAGERETLSGRDVWWAGHEGSLHDGLEDEEFESGSGVEYLTRTVAERPGEIDVVAIGPLTNIATAIQADPAFAQNVRSLCIMGGRFDGSGPEHNFSSDAVAASIVFSANVPTVVTGLEITTQVRIGEDQVAQIAAAGPLGAALARDIDQFWSFADKRWNVPHDPVAVLALVEPALFGLSEPGKVGIGVDSDGGAGSRLTSDTGGTTRVVVSLEASAVSSSIIAAIVEAGQDDVAAEGQT